MYRDSSGGLRTIKITRKLAKSQLVNAPGYDKMWIRGSVSPRPAGALDFGPNTSAIECVSSSPLFEGLPTPTQHELAKNATQRWFSNRQPIFQQDDPIQCVHVIGSGTVKITQLTEAGSEVILRLDGPGSPIDGVDCISEKTHNTNAYAVGDCCIFTWKPDKFASFAEQFPTVQRNANRILMMRIRMLESSICDLGTACVRQRLAGVLLRVTQQNGFASRSVGFSREELAQMVGTSLFMVSRLLSDWAQRGIVHVTREGIAIEDREGLVRLADSVQAERSVQA